MSDIAIKTAEYLVAKTLKRTPGYLGYQDGMVEKTKAKSQKCISDLLLTARFDDFKAVLPFSQADPFWRGKISTGEDLKKHYDTMLTQMLEAYND